MCICKFAYLCYEFLSYKMLLKSGQLFSYSMWNYCTISKFSIKLWITTMCLKLWLQTADLLLLINSLNYNRIAILSLSLLLLQKIKKTKIIYFTWNKNYLLNIPFFFYHLHIDIWVLVTSTKFEKCQILVIVIGQTNFSLKVLCVTVPIEIYVVVRISIFGNWLIVVVVYIKQSHAFKCLKWIFRWIPVYLNDISFDCRYLYINIQLYM